MSFPQILTLISLLALLVACSEQVPSGSAALQNSRSQAQTPPSGMPPNGMQPPFGAPPGGGPMGLPPNIENIRAQYPELAAALEAMQNLSPEERRTQMEALFSEHPEWREVLMPPRGGGPGGMQPGGMPPPQPSASPAA